MRGAHVVGRIREWIHKYRGPLAGLFVGVVLIVVERAVLYPQYEQVCTTTKQTGHHHCATYHVALIPLIEIGDFVENHDGAIVAIGTIVIAVFTYTLWWTTRGTLDQLRREFEAEYRPWIPTNIRLASGWTWTPDGEGRVTLQFLLRNTGKSPATYVDVRAEMFPRGWGFPDPAVAQRRLCETEWGGGMRWTIFPGDDSRSVEISLPLSAKDLERSRQALIENVPGTEKSAVGVMPVVVGCITYRFIGKTRHTGFIVEVQRLDPTNPNVRLALDPTAGDIPISELHLSDFMVGSAAID